jgi:predicted HicB family RNase H-like nuclease
MTDIDKYTISVRNGVFEGEVCFEAKVLELPDVAEYADSGEEAYALAIDAIQTIAQIFAEANRPMPSAVRREEVYSGRVTLRLPKSLHRAIAEQALEEGISLNQQIVGSLTYSSGYKTGLKVKDIWKRFLDDGEKIKGSGRVRNVEPIPLPPLKAVG